MLFNSSCISFRIFRSSAPSGSSRSSISGSLTIALAMAIRCCCPPDSVCIFRSSKSSRSTISNAFLTFFTISALGSFFNFSPNAIFSNTFRCGKRAYRWKTVLIGRLLGGRSRMSSPFSRSSPSVGLSKPAIMRSVVVLPQPDGPRNVTNSPRCTVRLKSSTTRKPSSKVRLIFFNSIILSPDVFLFNACPPLYQKELFLFHNASLCSVPYLRDKCY